MLAVVGGGPLGQGRRRMARTERMNHFFGRACFIIVRPFRLLVNRHDSTGCCTSSGDQQPMVPFESYTQINGKSERILKRVLWRPDQQLLVEYYQRQQHVERVEREPQQRQREQQRQDERPLCLAGTRRRMMAPSSLFYNDHPLFSLENIYRAYHRCRRRKRTTHNAMVFEYDLEENLLALQDELNSRRYRPGPSLAFMVEKPKRREIFAASFRDRVVHHLLVRHLEPKWERRFIHDSYACRKGKGTHRGVERLRMFTHKVTANGSLPAWYLQLDIRGFFLSIHRTILFERLRAMESDPTILWLLNLFVFYDPVHACRFRGACREDFLQLPDHKTMFKAQPGCGLPIGNLTSQFFANVYLDGFDQFVKHHLKARHYVRYCDDFVVLSQCQKTLQAWNGAIQSFLWENLRLQLNDKKQLRPVADGINFLGYIVRSRYLLVRRRVIGSLHERLARAEQTLIHRGMGAYGVERLIFPWPWPLLQQIRQWLASYQGHLRHANSYHLWGSILDRYNWLQEYFLWKRGLLTFRYPSPRFTRTVYQQRRYFHKQFPDHVLMIQFGAYWEMTSMDAAVFPKDTWLGRRFLIRNADEIRKQLLGWGRPVAWIKETGRRKTRIADRVLSVHWT